jgi:O-antigen/teichoic acid export membrane protein
VEIPESTFRRRPSLKVNALTNFGALAVNVAVGFFLTPAMLNYLGEKRFGIWTLVSSLVGYYGLLELGVGSAVFRYVPLFRGQGDHQRVGAVIGTSMLFYSALGLVVLLLTQVFAGFLARFFQGGPELAALLRVVGLATALGMPAIVLNTAVISYEGFAAANLVSASAQLLRGALLFACLLAGWGLVAMGWSLLVVGLVSLFGYALVFRRTCRDVRLTVKSARWQELKLLLSFGSVILIATTANSLATESPKQVVAKTISLDALGLFGIPLLLIAYYRQLVISLTKVFSPRFSYLSGRADQEAIRRLFLQGCRLVAILASGVALLLWVIGPAFLQLWTRKPAIAQAIPALLIMVSGTLVLLSHRLGSDLLFGLGHQKQVALFELLEAVGILGLTIVLSLQFGITGAALGLAIPPIIIRGLLQTRSVCRILELSFLGYYGRYIWRPWLIALALWLVAHLAGLPRMHPDWPLLVLLAAALTGAYGGLVYWIILDSGEKTALQERILRTARRIHPKLGAIGPRPAQPIDAAAATRIRD